ncbi:MAG: proline--tRNA ligase [Desulfatiglandaceae bacterium]|jgi:prolyl-tRNA synthetase
MRYSSYFIPTYREIPADAEIISHQLMLRAGLIRKLTSGIYTYLPAGLRSVKKVEQIVREEMNRAGAIEVLMPAVQPADLWKESGRWDFYGRELLRFTDRHNRDVCFGPTHEEVITDLVRKEIHSYKQLPINLYQIQTKFRDEIRPRFGLMRGREFIMKDAYSFDVDEAGAGRSYEKMYEAYIRIFQRCGLRFRAVEADSGAIGGSYSHEFMVLADSGEDQTVSCHQCKYAANLERAEVSPGPTGTPAEAPDILELEEVHTPDIKTIDELAAFLSTSPDRLLKTLVYLVDEKEIVAALVRGDHEINETKFRNFLGAQTVELAGPETVSETTGAPTGFAGPMGLKVKIVADRSVQTMTNLVAGANRKNFHMKNVNLDRDFQVEQFGDIRTITPSDPCPKCGGEIEFKRGIEVGHVFKLGTKYSKAMNAVFLDERGKEELTVMGCYGIGVGRTVAAAIEQNHDRDGIIFPIPIAPFEVILLPLQMHEKEVVEATETICNALLERGVEVLMDDRDERAGVKFMDADLLGIPVRVTVGKRGVKKGEVEMKLRTEKETQSILLKDAVDIVLNQVRLLHDSTK